MKWCTFLTITTLKPYNNGRRRGGAGPSIQAPVWYHKPNLKDGGKFYLLRVKRYTKQWGNMKDHFSSFMFNDLTTLKVLEAILYIKNPLRGSRAANLHILRGLRKVSKTAEGWSAGSYVVSISKVLKAKIVSFPAQLRYIDVYFQLFSYGTLWTSSNHFTPVTELPSFHVHVNRNNLKYALICTKNHPIR